MNLAIQEGDLNSSFRVVAVALRSYIFIFLGLICFILQIGGELMDFIIVLHGSKAVKTFTSRMHFSLGGGLSAAAGPVGRVFEADLRAGDKGSGMCYTYSCSKGIIFKKTYRCLDVW